MNPGNLKGQRETTSSSSSSSSRSNRAAVKLEIVEDSLEEKYGPIHKRSKASQTIQQWGAGANAVPVSAAEYNPLDEPSPLGLQLRKSPSLLDLIQMKLTQGNNAAAHATQETEKQNLGVKKESKSAAVSGSIDKLKASNFPASILRIGSWEYKSRYEGDLVAKCYFAKHKLVWEVLEGGLKSKIEIQWSDIMALKANCPDNEPATLNVVLARLPLFFRETNPQPRKHTLWQATADFTNGQASIHKQHFLQCSQGLLNKHFEKLIQCDMRLNFLSRQPEIILDSPYFEQRPSVFEDLDDSKSQDFNQVEQAKVPAVSGFQDLASQSAAQSSSLEIEMGDPTASTSDPMSREAPSPSSVMDTGAIEGRGICEAVDSKSPRNWDQIKVPGLPPSMSMTDLMNHIGNCISEQMTSANQPFSADGSECQDILEDIAQYLLSDTQQTTSSDEKGIMARVNSLCCLLQKDPASTQGNGESFYEEANNGKGVLLNHTNESFHENKARGDIRGSEGSSSKSISGSKPTTGMSRKDSFGDLLLHLPRIASLPKFLFNISEEDGNSQDR
ncbi:ATP-DEPENDENT DNA HELICASE [Salix purpurea]|uniref:ATP-DEPENDENT DNA HELICASE n=1 Tax=Salix purpurea TaxID=77065 RepID=A0A9Q0ZEL8_SALPP|nr:ATP-DEPENDENT DNA HELICASE [Salix purpurea]